MLVSAIYLAGVPLRQTEIIADDVVTTHAVNKKGRTGGNTCERESEPLKTFF